MGFFDWHDIWHIFSSFGFLISALAMIHDSYEPPKEIQDGDRPNYGSTQAYHGLESLVMYDSIEGAL